MTKSNPHHLPETLPPSAITVETEASTYELWVDTDFEPITRCGIDSVIWQVAGVLLALP